MRTFKPSPNSVCFRTGGVWSASEFGSFITAVEGIYEAFLSVYLAREKQVDAREVLQQSINKWYPILQKAIEGEPSGSLLIRDIFTAAMISSREAFPSTATEHSSYIAFIYENIRTLAPEHQLTIDVVRISSPGIVSALLGLSLSRV